jgi:hypothetical protein
LITVKSLTQGIAANAGWNGVFASIIGWMQDGPVADGVKIAKAVRTCTACPSQWDAWTPDGLYLYLRYRFGVGTVDRYDSPDPQTWSALPSGRVAYFQFGNALDGSIGLADFMRLAGLEWAEEPPRE